MKAPPPSVVFSLKTGCSRSKLALNVQASDVFDREQSKHQISRLASFLVKNHLAEGEQNQRAHTLLQAVKNLLAQSTIDQTNFVSVNELLKSPKPNNPIDDKHRALSLGFEVELLGIRAIATQSQKLDHGDELSELKSSEGGSIIKLVAEAPKPKKNVLVEAVTPPADSESDIIANLEAIKNLRQKIADGQRFEGQLNSNVKTIRKAAQTRRDERIASVQTTLAIPMRCLSQTLLSLPNAFEPHCELLFRSSMAQIDNLAEFLGFKSQQGKKTWEWLNMLIWEMSTNTLDSVISNSKNPNLRKNPIAKGWRRNSFKKFYGVIPRSSAADLLRLPKESCGLKIKDQHLFEQWMTGPRRDAALNTLLDACMNNYENLIESFAKKSSVWSDKRQFMWNYLSLVKPDYKAACLDRLKAKLIPGKISFRYFGESLVYGNEILADYSPMRVTLDRNRPEVSPVCVLWEFRRPEFKVNALAEQYFEGKIAANEVANFLSEYRQTLLAGSAST